MVRSLEVAPTLRRLYVLLTIRGQPLVFTLLLFAVLGLEPAVADAGGGTRIRVRGEGFPDGVMCQFEGGTTTLPLVRGPDLVVCHAPPSNFPGGEALEIAIGPDLVTKNRARVLRVATPTVTRLEPRRGYHSAGQRVTVFGYGFLASEEAACKFAAGGAEVVVRGPSNVTVLSGNTLLCQQPVLPQLPTPSYLEVSIDGQVFDWAWQCRRRRATDSLQRVLAPCQCSAFCSHTGKIVAVRRVYRSWCGGVPRVHAQATDMIIPHAMRGPRGQRRASTLCVVVGTCVCEEGEGVWDGGRMQFVVGRRVSAPQLTRAACFP